MALSGISASPFLEARHERFWGSRGGEQGGTRTLTQLPMILQGFTTRMLKSGAYKSYVAEGVQWPGVPLCRVSSRKLHPPEASIQAPKIPLKTLEKGKKIRHRCPRCQHRALSHPCAGSTQQKGKAHPA